MAFLSPDSSVRSACSVSMPPPPPPPPMPIMKRSRRVPSGSGVDGMPARSTRFTDSFERYDNPWQTASGSNGPGVAIGPPGGPGWSWPRLPRESASSKKTMTPP